MTQDIGEQTGRPVRAADPGRQVQLRTATRRAARAARPWGRGRLLLYRVVFGVALVGTWEAVVSAGLVDSSFLPSPIAIGTWIVDATVDGRIVANLLATALAMVVSFVVGSVAGIFVGTIFGRHEKLASIVAPFILFLNALPRVALAPLFILYLGITVWSKVAVGVSIVFFVLMLNTLAGLRSVDPDHLKLARLQRFSARQAFWKVSLPSALPAIFAGLKLAAVYALLGVVVSEMVASTNGLGQLVIYHTNTFELDGVFGTLFILAALAMALTSLMNAAEARLLAWQQHAHQ